MGLGSLPQFLVQVQTFTAIWGIAGPKNASSGTAAAMMYGYSRVNRNPAVLNKLDDVMSNMGFRPGEFKEALAGMEANGFHKVTGTHILQDNPWKYDFVSTGRKAALDIGAYPFRAGEQAVRYGAWFTAYKEYRALKPTGRLNQEDWGKILNRADTLSINMSRASASTWQQGIFSVPLQFLSYQIRMLELMLGRGRLTGAERARLAVANTLVYGVPGALGLTGLPLGDYWQQKARDGGYVIGEKWWSSLMNEGIPSYLVGMLTGKWYNISERYALQGLEQVRDIFTSDRAIWEMVLGVGGTTFADMFRSGYWPMHYAIKSGFRQDGPAFKLTSDHLIDFFKSASGFNNAWRTYMAVNYGKWFSKKENYLTDADKTDAFVSLITGLSPAKTADINFKQMALKDQGSAQAEVYFNNAFSALKMMDVPFEEHSRIISRALSGYESLARQIDWKYYMEKVPPSRQGNAPQALQQNSIGNR
jgi:hypothetical protein